MGCMPNKVVNGIQKMCVRVYLMEIASKLRVLNMGMKVTIECSICNSSGCIDTVADNQIDFREVRSSHIQAFNKLGRELVVALYKLEIILGVLLDLRTDIMVRCY